MGKTIKGQALFLTLNSRFPTLFSFSLPAYGFPPSKP